MAVQWKIRANHVVRTNIIINRMPKCYKDTHMQTYDITKVIIN